MPQSLRSQALTTLQKLVRIKAADDQGYCTCITCGCIKKWNDGIQGGHYIPKGSSSYWALEEENVHPQCNGCNNFGMRNGDAAQLYTLYMIDMYGRDFVEEMHRQRKKVRKYYANDYREMIATWREQIAEHAKRIGE
tara:strand:- start:46 stop:456 length:411 start_codon:yes stop_codon:yes gene_type:complete